MWRIYSSCGKRSNRRATQIHIHQPRPYCAPPQGACCPAAPAALLECTRPTCRRLEQSMVDAKEHVTGKHGVPKIKPAGPSPLRCLPPPMHLAAAAPPRLGFETGRCVAGGGHGGHDGGHAGGHDGGHAGHAGHDGGHSGGHEHSDECNHGDDKPELLVAMKTIQFNCIHGPSEHGTTTAAPAVPALSPPPPPPPPAPAARCHLQPPAGIHCL